MGPEISALNGTNKIQGAIPVGRRDDKNEEQVTRKKNEGDENGLSIGNILKGIGLGLLLGPVASLLVNSKHPAAMALSVIAPAIGLGILGTIGGDKDHDACLLAEAQKEAAEAKLKAIELEKEIAQLEAQKTTADEASKNPTDQQQAVVATQNVTKNQPSGNSPVNTVIVKGPGMDLQTAA